MAQMDVFDLWQKIMALVNTQQGGMIRPQRNFQTWMNEINRELHAEYFDKFEDSQRVDDALAKPFLKSVNVPLIPQSGQVFDLAPYPDDYAHYSSSRIYLKTGETKGCACQDLEFVSKNGSCKAYEDPDFAELKNAQRGSDLVEQPINKIDNQRWGSALIHPRLKPAPTRPYINQFSGGFKVAPKGIGIIILDYIKQPKDIVFAYTIDPVTDIVIYNRSASVQPEWDSVVEPEFMARLVKKFGIYTAQEAVYAIGDAERKIMS